jgi:hypothetical protein
MKMKNEGNRGGKHYQLLVWMPLIIKLSLPENGIKMGVFFKISS